MQIPSDVCEALTLNEDIRLDGVAVGMGILEGFIKSKIENSPPDLPYALESTPFKLSSDIYSGLKQLNSNDKP